MVQPDSDQENEDLNWNQRKTRRCRNRGTRGRPTPEQAAGERTKMLATLRPNRYDVLWQDSDSESTPKTRMTLETEEAGSGVRSPTQQQNLEIDGDGRDQTNGES